MPTTIGIPPKLQDFNKDNYSHAVDRWFDTMTKITNAQRTLTMATMSVNQSIASGVNTKVAFNTASVNTDGYFSTANNRFTASISGYYKFESQLVFDLSGFAGVSTLALVLELNGVGALSTTFVSPSIATTYNINQTFIIGMNGSTDFVEVYGFQNTGAARNIIAANSFLNVSLVRML